MASEMNLTLFQNITTLELTRDLQAGRQRVQEVCELLLQGIEQKEPDLRAFTSIEPMLVLETAQALDMYRLSGRPAGR